MCNQGKYISIFKHLTFLYIESNRIPIFFIFKREIYSIVTSPYSYSIDQYDIAPNNLTNTH